MSDIDFRNTEELKKALKLVQHTVYKKYLNELDQYFIVEPTQVLKDETVKNCDRFFQLQRLSCKKDEDMYQKLSTVYNASMLLGCRLAIIIDVDGNDAPCKIYMGMHCDAESDRQLKENLNTSFNTLKNGLMSNFPGSMTKSMNWEKTTELIDSALGKNAKNIASVSCVAAVRDKSKTENKSFIQGIERFIDAMNGNAYTAIFIAEPISKEELAGIRNGYETLYTAISPFSKSVWSYNENESTTVMNSLSKSVSESITSGTNYTQTCTIGKGVNLGINSSFSNSHGVSSTQTHSETKPPTPVRIARGISAVSTILSFVPVAGPYVKGAADLVKKAVDNYFQGYSVTDSISESLSDTIGKTLGLSGGVNANKSDATSKGKFNSNTMQNGETSTEGTNNTEGAGRTLQIEYINKYISEMLSKIDSHLKRTREGEDYGSYNCASYFIASKPDVSLLAANTYRALMVGEGSSVESGAINFWNEPSSVDTIKEYLKKFTHPLFAMPISKKVSNADDLILYTPATVVSGLELPLHLGLPNKSVNGLTVMQCAEFDRNINSLSNNNYNDILFHIGNVFHMNHEEKTAVDLLANSLSSHTFITGSTGSGKSNAVYQILSEASKNNVNFLIVEPAKGEYKHVFGMNENVSVYGTNPALSELLCINPFSFPSGIHILEHTDRLVEIFNVCWPMYAAMPAVLKNAVEKAYEDCGWDLTVSVNKYHDNLYPTFADVARNVKKIIDSSEYDSENKGAYKGSLLTRLYSLTNGIEGMIFTNHEISPVELFDKNVIVDLSRVGSLETKSLIMGMLVLKLQEYRMTSGRMNAELKHFTVLEEAHNLLKRTSVEQVSESANLLGKSVEMLSNAIAEMRTYGEGFIIADQAPALLDMAVIRNTNTKIIFRLPDLSDRELVGASANLNENQIIELAKLPCGVAAIYQNEWIQPVLCKVEKYNIPDTIYTYHCIKKDNFSRKLTDMISIAQFLSNGKKFSHKEILINILPKLQASNINASVQVSIARQLENPSIKPRMTQFAPIMCALFPELLMAMRTIHAETHSTSEWNRYIENTLCDVINQANQEIDNRTRNDIIQGVITHYLLNEINDISSLKKWSEERGVK